MKKKNTGRNHPKLRKIRRKFESGERKEYPFDDLRKSRHYMDGFVKNPSIPIPQIRQSFSDLVAAEICSVQPMTGWTEAYLELKSEEEDFLLDSIPRLIQQIKDAPIEKQEKMKEILTRFILEELKGGKSFKSTVIPLTTPEKSVE